MTTLKGTIDDKFGIKIIYYSDGTILTSFLLNTGKKQYPIFFDQKITLSPSSTVEATGEMSTSPTSKIVAEEAEPISIRDQIIKETLLDMATKNLRAFKGESTELQGPYLVATEIRDCQQNISYVLYKSKT